jgi:hypothetical protein
VAGGDRRRGSSANPILGFGARLEAREASTRSARDGKANRGGSCDRDAAARAEDAAAWQGSSGEVASATGCTGTSTSGTGGLLSSLRGSWVASRRRSGGEARNRRRRRKARVRVPMAAVHEGKAARVGTSKGGRRLIRAGRTALACGLRARTRTRGGLGASSGVRVDPVARNGMTGGPHRSATAGAAQAERWADGGGLLGRLGRTATRRASWRAELAGAARTSWRDAQCWAVARAAGLERGDGLKVKEEQGREEKA